MAATKYCPECSSRAMLLKTALPTEPLSFLLGAAISAMDNINAAGQVGNPPEMHSRFMGTADLTVKLVLLAMPVLVRDELLRHYNQNRPVPLTIKACAPAAMGHVH